MRRYNTEVAVIRTSADGLALLATRHAEVVDARERVRIACGAVLAAGLVLTAAGGRQHALGAFVSDVARAHEVVHLARGALSAASPVEVAARRRRCRLLHTLAILGLIAVVAGCDTLLCTDTSNYCFPYF